MEPADEVIVRHYERTREEDRLGPLELRRAQEVLRRQLPAPPADVLDVGGATGVHSAWLAGDGYRVRLVDISPRHVERARTELSPDLQHGFVNAAGSDLVAEHEAVTRPVPPTPMRASTCHDAGSMAMAWTSLAG